MSGFSASLPNSTEAAQGITPSGSPFTWVNTVGVSVQVIVSGGTVTIINLRPQNATDVLVGLVAGTALLRPGDAIKVTYAVAPTMSYVRCS